MKEYVTKIFSLFKRLFLFIRIHIHVGAGVKDPKDNSESDTNEE